MSLRLLELQESDKEIRKIRAKGLSRYKEINEILHHQELLFVLEIIGTKLISGHYTNSLTGHFYVDKTRELIGRKYYWLSLRKNVESYIKGCDVYLSSKTVKHKPYSDLQLLPIPTHGWKDLSIDFVSKLLVSTDWKGETYDSILVIVD